ncbi:1-acyl-sn-glycerol-3-phosphate acyltransferase [Pontibacter sp. 172403-2]|uniref:lysophospholipid acyltransferase family protein n=1 Tax=Pontibacter rufus TaxID=2791028 RepID=UPI0018AF9824|nr:lysophospholipid acyltransferase family protein [Pontibacter sp. 172403-2]MBF9255296.1 1-acyl-sn-glycerol-3-phosphate acyltransferase [Pontibacter sp. 172403-2]
MLYAILKLIYRIGLRVFFRQLEVRRRDLMPQQGPLLIVSNHPNTFMDPVVIAAQLKQPVYFIAKSTVFGSSVQNWLLRKMHLIPIHRREDNPEQPVSNEEAFAAIFKALAQQKTLIIFPEGNSFNERRLRKIKTGTARIALSATADTGLDIQILPVGLNYTAPTRFRSSVFVNVGKPINVADYAEAYKTDGPAAVLALTEEIRQRLEKLTINTPTAEEDELARNIEAIYKEQLWDEVPPLATTYEKEFLLTKGIVRSINYFYRTQPERVAVIRQKLQNYMLQLHRLHLQDTLVGQGRKSVLWQFLRLTVYLVLGFPAYVFGLLHNYVPYIIPSKIARAVTHEEEWHAPIMLTAGIFTFPLAYTSEVWLLSQVWQPATAAILLYLLSLPLSGFFALHYWSILKHTQGHWTLLRLFSKRQLLVEDLRRQQEELRLDLEQARQEYLREINLHQKSA